MNRWDRLKKIIFTQQFSITFICGVMISLIIWIWQPEDQIPFFVLVISILIILILIYIIAAIFEESEKICHSKIEPVKFYYSGADLVCVFRPNKDVKENELYTIVENPNECLLFLGYISLVQESGLIQLTIFKCFDRNLDLSLENINNIEFISKLFVKTVKMKEVYDN